MRLNKSQIKYIDDYLKHHKFKYWDIRFEVLDHIVNTVESKMDEGVSFDDAMIEVHQSFGNSMKMFWNTGVEHSIFANGNGYKNLIQNKKKELLKKYRNLMFKEFKSFFRSFKNIMLIIVFILIEIKLYALLDSKTFMRVNVLSILIPLLVYIYIFIRYYKKNLSFALESIPGQLIIPFVFASTVFRIEKTDIPDYISYLIIVGYLIISSIWFFSGLKVYREKYKEFNQFYKELQTI